MQGVDSHHPEVPQRWSAGHEVAVHAGTQAFPEPQHGYPVDWHILPAPQSVSRLHSPGGGGSEGQAKVPHRSADVGPLGWQEL